MNKSTYKNKFSQSVLFPDTGMTGKKIASHNLTQEK